jgi:LysR family transcriptional regulator for metE and metH
VSRIGSPDPRLDVRDLRVVLALGSAGSTAAAGAAMHLTQSAVSRALLLAEEKLGARLFERTARGLTPTPAGERLLRGAGPILAQLVALEDEARLPVVPPVRVRLVCECYTAYRWLPTALAALRERLPNVEIALAVDHTRAPVAALAAGEVDVALLTTSPVTAGLREKPLFSDEIVFVLAESHPLAARSSLSPQDLREHPLISGNTPPAESEWFMRRAFGKKRPKVEFLRFPLTEAVIDATRAGMGVAVLSEWIASSYLDAGGLVAKRLGTEPLRRPWRIAFRPEAAAVAERLASALTGSAPRVFPKVTPIAAARAARAKAAGAKASR